MRRDEGCKGCAWNFGRPDFPCSFCNEHDLFIELQIHHSENEEIQKVVIGIISAVIFLLAGYAVGMGIKEIINNGEIQ